MFRYAVVNLRKKLCVTIVGSLDPCYSCTDRVTVTDVAAKRDHVLDKEQFENVWRDKSPLAGEGTMAAPLDEEAL